MSLFRRIAREQQRDRELEAATRITRTQPQTIGRDDINRLEEQMVPWLRKKRRGR